MQKEGELVFPYVYGSMAFSMGKKSQSYTHKWICYVRGVNNENLSYLIKKVVFILHSSFQNPVKQIYNPPYQIQQVGWGQFEIQIQIHFNHPDMPHIQVPHMLKLHHHNHGTGSQVSKKQLCSQVYDQIVFTQIDPHLLKILEVKQSMSGESMAIEDQNNQQNQLAVIDQPLKSIVHYTKYLTFFDKVDHKNRLQDALRFIKGQISSLEQKMRIADMDIQKVYEDLYNKVL